MLEMQMYVLKSISDDEVLFKKELEKSFKWLNSTELEILKNWLFQNYSVKYKDVIEQAFASQAA